MSVIDDFFEHLSEPNRVELERIRRIVHEAIPDAKEAISYGIPAFTYNDKYLVGFCAYKKHLSLFPAAAPIERFKEKLQAYKLSAGTIQFTLENPLPEPLIKEIILSRLADIKEK